MLGGGTSDPSTAICNYNVSSSESTSTILTKGSNNKINDSSLILNTNGNATLSLQTPTNDLDVNKYYSPNIHLTIGDLSENGAYSYEGAYVTFGDLRGRAATGNSDSNIIDNRKGLLLIDEFAIRCYGNYQDDLDMPTNVIRFIPYSTVTNDNNVKYLRGDETLDARNFNGSILSLGIDDDYYDIFPIGTCNTILTKGNQSVTFTSTVGADGVTIKYANGYNDIIGTASDVMSYCILRTGTREILVNRQVYKS